MMWATNLADILRSAGLKVVEVDGWRTRGAIRWDGVRHLTEMRGIMWHHTATPASAGGDYPTLGVVRDGTSALSGPLAQLGLGRSGTWYVIAAGRAHHAGLGSWAWLPTDAGNEYCLAVEAEHPGDSTPWPEVQLDSYHRGTAAILKAFGRDASRCVGHKEYAPTRKIDPIRLDMSAMRATINRYMEDDDMFEAKDRAKLEALFEFFQRQTADRPKGDLRSDIMESADRLRNEPTLADIRNEVRSLSGQVETFVREMSQLIQATPYKVWDTDDVVVNIYDNPDNPGWKAGMAVEHMIRQLRAITEKLEAHDVPKA